MFLRIGWFQWNAIFLSEKEIQQNIFQPVPVLTYCMYIHSHKIFIYGSILIISSNFVQPSWDTSDV